VDVVDIVIADIGVSTLVNFLPRLLAPGGTTVSDSTFKVVEDIHPALRDHLGKTVMSSENIGGRMLFCLF
jgi:hypothetical protein